MKSKTKKEMNEWDKPLTSRDGAYYFSLISGLILFFNENIILGIIMILIGFYINFFEGLIIGGKK